MALPAAATYDKIDRPYNADMQRSEFSNTVENIPGTTQEEGGRTIKTGEALTDVWIDTWIKSRTYQPKSQGFMLNSKGGYIECMDFSIGTGIDMYGNDAYFYDYTEAAGGTYIQTATASLNFQRKYYPDQNFIMQKRVGYASPSVGQSDNVFEMFYENPAQSGRRNYIFIGGRGDATSISDENTDIVRIFAKQVFQLGTEPLYGTQDISLYTGAYSGTCAYGSTRMEFTIKDTSSTGYYDPANPGSWTAAAFIIAAKKGSDPTRGILVADMSKTWTGNSILPLQTGVHDLGGHDYFYSNIYASRYWIDQTHSIYYTTMWELGGGGSLLCDGDIQAGGNLIAIGTIVQVDGNNFMPMGITYKDGSGSNVTRTFLVA